jgi:hypothetical protein
MYLTQTYEYKYIRNAGKIMTLAERYALVSDEEFHSHTASSLNAIIAARIQELNSRSSVSYGDHSQSPLPDSEAHYSDSK